MSESERKAKLELRKTHQKLTRLILQGTDYSEPYIVKVANGTEAEIMIRPLGEGEILDAYQAGGLNILDVPNPDEIKKRISNEAKTKGETLDEKTMTERVAEQIQKEVKKNLHESVKVQFELIARAGTGEGGETWTASELGRLLRFGESGRLSDRILELSGIVGANVKAVETFRQKPTQQ